MASFDNLYKRQYVLFPIHLHIANSNVQPHAHSIGNYIRIIKKRLANIGSSHVTLPAALFDSMTEEDIKKTAEENGYSGCVVHEDGSVTYTMTKTKHKEMLEELKKSMDESIKNLTEGENAVASFMSIDYTDDYSEVNIQVNADEYTQWDNFYALAFYMTGAYYQSFAGVAPDKIDVVVHFIDGDTKEVLSTTSYRDYVNEMESSGDANHSNESSGV